MKTSLVYNYENDRPIGVEFGKDTVSVQLADGMVLHTPLALHPWLAEATAEQRANFELNPFDVWWTELEDGLDIEWMRQQSTPAHVHPETPTIRLTSDWLFEIVDALELPTQRGEIASWTEDSVQHLLDLSLEIDYSTTPTKSRKERAA